MDKRRNQIQRKIKELQKTQKINQYMMYNFMFGFPYLVEKKIFKQKQ